ncbi:MAG: hypothetical protein ACXWD4_15415, partial [Bacteroidia bacterium]
DIDTTIYKAKEPLDLFINFLRTADDSAGAAYWNKAEVENYGKSNYFLVENEINRGTENYLHFIKMAATIRIMSIRKIDNFYKIRYMLCFNDPKLGEILEEFYHIYAGYENGSLKLYNPLPINATLYCNSKTVGYVKYHYPKYHKFNNELAEKQNVFLQKMSKRFNMKLDTVDYYFAATREELDRLRGYDWRVGSSGEEIPEGKAKPENNTVFCTGLGEYCPHELIHIFFIPKFPDAHFWFHEGLATFLDGSRGYDLNWHLKKLNLYLKNHPEIDLTNMLKYRTIDQYTDFRYALGGFLMKLAYEKGGDALMEKLLQSGKSQDNFYATIEHNLGVQRKDLNIFIREELDKSFR